MMAQFLEMGASVGVRRADGRIEFSQNGRTDSLEGLLLGYMRMHEEDSKLSKNAEAATSQKVPSKPTAAPEVVPSVAATCALHVAEESKELPAAEPTLRRNSNSRRKARREAWKKEQARVAEKEAIRAEVRAEMQAGEDARMKQAIAQHDEDSRVCGICFERPRNLVFTCGHPFCEQCVCDMNSCPTCRKPIEARIKLFW